MLVGTSMGGARPKVVVEHGHDLWIAKFTCHEDRWNHPRVEHGMSKLAEACGISVADSNIATVGGRDVLLVRRFDRDGVKDGYRRHRMVSALTLLKSDDDPGTRRDWSYILLASEPTWPLPDVRRGSGSLSRSHRRYGAEVMAADNATLRGQ